MPPPVPGLDAFANYFRGLFGSGESSSEPAALAAKLDSAEVPAFSASEVQAALGRMATGKSSGLARYSVDLLRFCHASLY